MKGDVSLSDRRFIKGVEKTGAGAKTARELNQAALQVFETHRSGLPIPDDVTIVTIRFNN